MLEGDNTEVRVDDSDDGEDAVNEVQEVPFLTGARDKSKLTWGQWWKCLKKDFLSGALA